MASHIASGTNFIPLSAMERVCDESVLFWIDDIGESIPESIEDIGIEVAFEDAELDAQSIIQAAIGDLF